MVWDSEYIEQMDEYFVANDLTSETNLKKKHVTLLSSVGRKITVSLKVFLPRETQY